MRGRRSSIASYSACVVARRHLRMETQRGGCLYRSDAIRHPDPVPDVLPSPNSHAFPRMARCISYMFYHSQVVSYGNVVVIPWCTFYTNKLIPSIEVSFCF
ncbi:hypothetical protein, unlikely [Trypanosoma congolense IL3000]|uniref:Uncharacterized protein n=1 Tax=Trypanosoma congolense (strain IL3000) TaxID=1068625 RepID=F9W930_TRYCI|nr:hypothetical protein, unlikely [Trypanosoma congolense IL3000]